MQLFRFANPDFLYLLLLLPVLILVYIINEVRKKRALKRLGDIKLVASLVPEMSKIRPVIKFILQITAFTAGIIMLSRPQFGSKIEDYCSRCEQLYDGRRYSARQAYKGKTGNFTSG
jgi:Ca-activated chloride channel family protein